MSDRAGSKAADDNVAEPADLESTGFDFDEVVDLGEVSHLARERDAARPRTVAEHLALNTFNLRRNVAFAMTAAFLIANGAVMFGLYVALMFDFQMIQANTPNYSRFITETVIASLLAATTVQLGAIMLAVAKFLFPGNNGSN